MKENSSKPEEVKTQPHKPLHSANRQVNVEGAAAAGLALAVHTYASPVQLDDRVGDPQTQAAALAALQLGRVELHDLVEQVLLVVL